MQLYYLVVWFIENIYIKFRCKTSERGKKWKKKIEK